LLKINVVVIVSSQSLVTSPPQSQRLHGHVIAKKLRHQARLMERRRLVHVGDRRISVVHVCIFIFSRGSLVMLATWLIYGF
jgi:hypothetical protein